MTSNYINSENSEDYNKFSDVGINGKSIHSSGDCREDEATPKSVLSESNNYSKQNRLY